MTLRRCNRRVKMLNWSQREERRRSVVSQKQEAKFRRRIKSCFAARRRGFALFSRSPRSQNSPTQERRRGGKRAERGRSWLRGGRKRGGVDCCLLFFLGGGGREWEREAQRKSTRARGSLSLFSSLSSHTFQKKSICPPPSRSRLSPRNYRNNGLFPRDLGPRRSRRAHPAGENRVITLPDGTARGDKGR